MRKIITDQPERVAEFVGDKVNAGGYANYTAIGLEEDGKLIAGVLYDYYNGASMNAHIAGEGTNWLNRKYLHFIFWYPFEQLKVKRLTVLVPESNKESNRFVRHLGFDLEATLRDAAPDGDVFLYRMFRHQCKWLEMRVKHEQS